jgi:hypothetical protein
MLPANVTSSGKEFILREMYLLIQGAAEKPDGF